MDSPTVYVEREPFLNMLIASVDTFKRECFGYFFGLKPTRKKNAFFIQNVFAVQSTIKRANTEVRVSKGCLQRLDRIFSKYPGLYPSLGYFHSHPEWGSVPGSHEMSDIDITEMANSDSEIAVVLKIASRKRERLNWVSKADGGMRGSYGDFVIDFNVYRLLTEDDQRTTESLQVNAFSVLKDLNKANQK